MALRAVIFDVGDVLLRTVDHHLRAEWEQRLGLAPGQAEIIVFGGESGWDVQRGLVTDEEHWRRVQARLRLDDDAVVRFRADFFAGDQLDTGLLAYLGRLRSRYHVGLLSNATRAARAVLTERYPIIPCVDSVTISAEEGIMKPDPRIYEIALARAGVSAGEALFVDDSLRNIEGARAVGMAVLHYVDPAEGRRELVRLTGVPDVG